MRTRKELESMIKKLKEALEKFNDEGGVLEFCIDNMKLLDYRDVYNCSFVVREDIEHSGITEWIRCLKWVLEGDIDE